MMMFLRNSCSQNSHQQIFKRKAEWPLSSALLTDGAHDTALLRLTVLPLVCLRFSETLTFPKYNLKTFTHHYFTCLNLLENFCQTALKHKAKKIRTLSGRGKIFLNITFTLAKGLELWLNKGVRCGDSP